MIFVALSFAGLGINELLMWTGVSTLSLNHLFVKVGATAVVAAWNLWSRKRWLDDGRCPSSGMIVHLAIYSMLGRILVKMRIGVFLLSV